MKKIRLAVLVAVFALSFTACNTTDSLDQLIEDTEIETPQSTDEDDGEDPATTNS